MFLTRTLGQLICMRLKTGKCWLCWARWGLLDLFYIQRSIAASRRAGTLLTSVLQCLEFCRPERWLKVGGGQRKMTQYPQITSNPLTSGLSGAARAIKQFHLYSVICSRYFCKSWLSLKHLWGGLGPNLKVTHPTSLLIL